MILPAVPSPFSIADMRLLNLHHGCARVIVKAFVLREFSKRTFSAIDAIRDGVESRDNLIGSLVHGRIVDEFAGRALAIFDFGEECIHARPWCC